MTLVNSTDSRSRLALLAILVLALILRVYGLDQNGWGADYYSAAVRSMSMNWHNFFFASFDPAGFISVDKPPLALWIQVLAVKAFGFQPLVLLLPQALMGVASVWVLHHLVNRNFGQAPALVAALLFAITPVVVAVNRSNVCDTTLLLVLLLAGWAMLKATEESNAKRLILAMGLAGVAFNVKMLAGLVLLPVFLLIYLTMAKKPLVARVRDLTVAGCVLVLVLLSWVMIVQLTDPAHRPYIGSSRNNSMLELVVGHNAMERFVSRSRSAAQDRAAVQSTVTGASPGQAQPAGIRSMDPMPSMSGEIGSMARELRLRLFVRAATGPTRLFSGQLAAQVAWFVPLVLFGLIGWLGMASERRNRPVPTVLAEIQLAHRRKISLWFWIGWLLVYLIVYSALGGIFHYYYLSTLAPAWAVLVGLAATVVWKSRGSRSPMAFLLPLLPLLTVGWQFYLQLTAMGWTSKEALWSQPDGWLNQLHVLVLLATVGAACSMLLARWLVTQGKPYAALRFDAVGLGTTAVGLMLIPMAWTLSSVLVPASGVLPSADLYRWQALARDSGIARVMRFGRLPDQSRLIEFLTREQQNPKFLLATSTSIGAAPLIIVTGKAIMARGGYHGLDPVTTPQSLQRLVEQGQLRYAMLNDVPALSRRLGADRAGAEVAAWIRANGTLVDPSLWRNETLRSEAQLYDLRAPPAK